ncbi:MAG: hypothetical protein JWM62_1139 [Frankiales bacterium]|jgi:hypothetical protein|nr:hypothetical protein [Frankiales bacterium]
MLRRTLVLALTATVGLPAAVTLLPAQAAPLPVPDLTVAAARQVDPVVLTGEAFGTWAVPSNVTAKAPLTDLFDCQSFDDQCEHNHYEDPEVDSSTLVAPEGTDVSTLSGWRWDGSRFVEVPFQVDEVFTRYLDNSASGFSVYSGTDQHTTYAFDREGFRFTESSPTDTCLAVAASEKAVDPIKGLDSNDEVVFMARDAGGQAPAEALRPHGTTGVKQVTVVDPLTQQTSYLYVMQGLAPSFTADTGYVRYTRDAIAGTFEKSESSYDNYGNAATGPYCDAAGNVVRKADGSPDVQRRRPRDYATVETDRYRYRYDGRWLMTDVRVKEDQATTYGADLVDRWKARAFQQDAESETPCCGYEEEDTNWGGSSTLLGERSGPVRTVRETWGADSGTNVIRRETFYRDDMVMKTWLRVHVIPPLDGIYAQWDYNAGVMTKHYNPNIPAGVAVDGQNDEVLGNFDDPCNAKYDANGTGEVTQTYRDVYKQAGLCESFPYHQSFDVTDPTMSKPGAALDWSVTAGPEGTIVDRYSFEPGSVTAGGLAQSVAAVPYYRDDACFDDATGTNPGPRLKLRSAGEPTTDPATGLPRRCWTPQDGVVDNSTAFFQGDIGAHGVHLLFLVDSDNARQTVPVNEIVFSQRQVFLPGQRDGSVGEQFGRGFEKPLVALATDATFAEAPPAAPEKVRTELAYDGDTMPGPQKAVRLAATLTTSGGAPVAGEPVVFTFDGRDYPATTGPDGRATAQATYPKGNARSVDVLVVYAGDDAREPSRTTATVRRKE